MAAGSHSKLGYPGCLKVVDRFRGGLISIVYEGASDAIVPVSGAVEDQPHMDVRPSVGREGLTVRLLGALLVFLVALVLGVLAVAVPVLAFRGTRDMERPEARRREMIIALVTMAFFLGVAAIVAYPALDALLFANVCPLIP